LFQRAGGEPIVGLRQARHDLLVALGLDAPALQRTLQHGHPVAHLLDQSFYR